MHDISKFKHINYSFKSPLHKIKLEPIIKFCLKFSALITWNFRIYAYAKSHKDFKLHLMRFTGTGFRYSIFLLI